MGIPIWYMKAGLRVSHNINAAMDVRADHHVFENFRILAKLPEIILM